MGAPEACASKNGLSQVDAKEHPGRSHKMFIFTTHFEDFVLLRPHQVRLCFCIFFYKQKSICFIDVSDSFTGPMLHHLNGHAKVKNERHAAWERSGAKRNERHAPWERFLHPDGPDVSPKKAPPKMPQTVIFKRYLMLFGSL